IPAPTASYYSAHEQLSENQSPAPTPSAPAANTISETSVPTTPEPSAQPMQSSFSILAAGDVMAHADNLRAAYDKETGTYSFIENYTLVKPLIEGADLAIANLETVTAGESSGYTSFPLFNTPDAILDGLKYAGFDVIVTANNHSLDRGQDGILRTLAQIKDRDLLSTGTYEEKGKNYLTATVAGTEVSILAYTQHLNGNDPMLGPDRNHMVNKMDRESIVLDIRTAATHSGLVIVYLHWGEEYTRQTEEWQSAYARALFEAGADVILGTHPHVVRPDETFLIDGEYKYVIYSMGNFISNFIRQDKRANALYTEDGVMIILDFDVDGSGKVSLRTATPVPTWPYKYEDGTGLHYEIIPVPDPDSIVHADEYARAEAIASYHRTMELLKGFGLQ
ncbi:MAG: CapA family protein, partial [Clostridia bacterium]|nr:CapA family protein [Clostridia bacterium]